MYYNINMSLCIEDSDEKVRKIKNKKIPRAPREIVPISNPDKKKHESYKKSHNPIRFPKLYVSIRVLVPAVSCPRWHYFRCQDAPLL